ncbi:MAG: ABC transporter permease [Myxococcota bacterium]
MFKYAVRKILMALPLILGVVTLIFVLLEIAPGTPIDRYITPEMAPEVRDNLIARYGLNEPAWYRYLLMLWNLVTLDLGDSMTHNRPVLHLILDALPNTLLLSSVTLMVIFPVGIAMGTLQAVRQGRAEDTAISVGSLFFYSMPRFWLALMLQLILAFWLSEWLKDTLPDITGLACGEMKGLVTTWCEAFPLDGKESPTAFTWPEWNIIPPALKAPFLSLIYGAEHALVKENAEAVWSPWQTKRIADLIWHLMLPGVALGVASAASTARYMRSSLLEVVRQDYIRTARAKGLPERVVVLKHALRNALLPIVTIMGLSLPFLFSGAVLTEYIFSWPGMGRLTVEAIFAQDTPVIIACFVIFAMLVVLGNLIADLLYAVVDPRIRYD